MLKPNRIATLLAVVLAVVVAVIGLNTPMAAEAQNDEFTCTVSMTQSVNLRSGPGSEYERLATTASGDTLVFIGYTSDWVLVALDRDGQEPIAGFIWYDLMPKLPINQVCYDLEAVWVEENTDALYIGWDENEAYPVICQGWDCNYSPSLPEDAYYLFLQGWRVFGRRAEVIDQTGEYIIVHVSPQFPPDGGIAGAVRFYPIQSSEWLISQPHGFWDVPLLSADLAWHDDFFQLTISAPSFAARISHLSDEYGWEAKVVPAR